MEPETDAHSILGLCGGGCWARGGKPSTETKRNHPEDILSCGFGVLSLGYLKKNGCYPGGTALEKGML
jgi:hypothetical protein